MTSSSNNLKLLIAAFIVCVCIVESRFHCHNRCSGHGYCSDYDNICYCEDGYEGVDCSQRLCPTDFAWADKPYDVDLAHAKAECSGAGKCNRRTGRCECSPGFTGIACQNTKCGGSGFDGCNGRGDCLTLKETYLQVTAFQGLNTSHLYDGAERSLWEETHTTMCSCHKGYAGASCEYRLCPKGDDKLTPHTGYRTITLTVNSESKLNRLSGLFQFQFNGESFLFPPGQTDFTAADCKAAVEGLRNVEEVTCALTATAYETKYQISFLHFPTLPYENNVFSNDGNPPLSAFSCNMDRVVKARELDGLSCEIGELYTDKVYPEYAPCSNRGICDFSQGVCYCFEQFSGAACGSYKKAIAEFSERAVSTSEVLIIESSNPEFDRTILQLQTFDIGTPAFNSIKVKNLERTVFQMDGYGNIDMFYGGLTIGDTTSDNPSSGMSVDSSGLTVTGGVTANTDTLVIDGRVKVKSGGVTVASGGVTVEGDSSFHDTSSITGGMVVANGFNVAQGINVAAGGGTIKTGGLLVRGGLTVFSSGLVLLKRGVTIYTDGLVITGGIQLLNKKSTLKVADTVSIDSGGFTVTGGITADDSGMAFSSLSIGADGLVAETMSMNSGAVFANGGCTVTALGLVLAGGMTVNSGGMDLFGTTESAVSGLTVYDSGAVVTDGITINSGGFTVGNGLTIPTGNMYVDVTTPALVKTGVMVTGGVTVALGGMTATGGLTVGSSGLFVTSGGLTIAAGGLRVVGGYTVTTGGQSIVGGVTVNNVGFRANDEFIITAGGLGVAGGVTVSSDGLVITNGVTISSQGVRITGGLSVDSNGLKISGGLTLFYHGLEVTGGVTAYTRGLRVSGGLTNYGTVSGFTLTGGLSVQIPGMAVTHGVTVHNGGLVVVAGGLTVELGGLLVTSGLTIANGGLKVDDGGLSVMIGSLRVTGGLTIGDPTALSNVLNAMTVYDAGRITGGWSINTGGMAVGQGGTISGSGLQVFNGVTVYNGGVAFSGTVEDPGMKLTGGLTVSSEGMFITTSGLTIKDDGLIVTGGVTVQDLGLTTTGGLTIRSTGLRLVSSGSLSLYTVGLTVTGGMTIERDGFKSEGTSNFHISSGGLVLDDQLKVGADGAHVTGGVTLSDTGISMYSLVVKRNGVRSSSVLQDYGGLVVSGDSTIKSAGMKVTDGMTVRSGLTFSSTTSTFVNSVDAGEVYILGATAVEVPTGGVFTGEGLTVNGAVYLGSTPTVSDARLKTNVSVLNNPLDMLATIRGVYYNWKDPAWDVQSGRIPKVYSDTNTTTPKVELQKREMDTHDSTSEPSSDVDALGAIDSEDVEPSAAAADPLRFVGLLAQQVQRVLPEAVSHMQLGGAASHLGVKYTDLVALLIEAIKEIDLRTSATPHAMGRHSQRAFRRSSAYALDEGLLRTYFDYGDSYGDITAVKPYKGTCACADKVLSEVIALLMRVKHLEDEEARLIQQIDSLQAS